MSGFLHSMSETRPTPPVKLTRDRGSFRLMAGQLAVLLNTGQIGEAKCPASTTPNLRSARSK